MRRQQNEIAEIITIKDKYTNCNTSFTMKADTDPQMHKRVCRSRKKAITTNSFEQIPQAAEDSTES